MFYNLHPTPALVIFIIWIRVVSTSSSGLPQGIRHVKLFFRAWPVFLSPFYHVKVPKIGNFDGKKTFLDALASLAFKLSLSN